MEPPIATSSSPKTPPIAFVVPGRLDQINGGYLYDRRMVEGMQAAGRRVAVAELPGKFPEGDAVARRAAGAILSCLPDNMALAIDGLALPAFTDCLAREARRLRVVGMIHHPLALETGLEPAEARRLAELERWCVTTMRGVICPSPGTARAIAGYGLARDRIVVVPPGTAAPLSLGAASQGAASLEAAPRGAGPMRLLSVGTVTPRKGHVLLIEALATLTRLSWRLVIVGSLERDPPTVAALRAAIDRAELGHRVELTGEWPSERLSAAYAAADLFVLPSFHEGYGMVYAEAMAHGLPILATTAGAIPDTVPSSAGMLVPPGDRSALAEALRRLLTEADTLARLRQGAAEAGAALPDWPRAIELWTTAFDRLTGGRATAR
ncbi:MAG TPA: glycosyltransferase family 4 protein [Stellaceae bacterium]|nr:glycosyltransferase family 4 protein [Stellaceae bacterium]